MPEIEVGIKLVGKAKPLGTFYLLLSEEQGSSAPGGCDKYL